MSPRSTPLPGHVHGEPFVVEKQGSMTAGGSVVRHPGDYRTGRAPPDGQTLHGDHVYAFYQIPPEARRHPLVMIHGNGQSSRTWETTPDGREGFQTLFLRRGYGTYLVDMPRRGKAGQSTAPRSLEAVPSDQFWFNVFRIGVWPEYFPGVQFAPDPGTLDQYLRQMTPDTGPFDLAVAASSIASLLETVGPAVLVTHSQGGGIGWSSALRSPNVKGIVSYEPGSNFPFPEGEVPPAMPSSAGPLHAFGVPLAEFERFTSVPTVIYYGDYIPKEPVENPGQDQWRVRAAMATLWAEAVNRRGGDVSVVELPDIGVHGNTHFPFSDRNNGEIADLMARFLRDRKLD